MSEKKRIPLNEEGLEAVAGGAGAEIIPDWARAHVTHKSCCQACVEKGVVSIAPVVSVQQSGDSYTVKYQCSCGNTWSMSFDSGLKDMHSEKGR